jgi:hypothetical protein
MVTTGRSELKPAAITRKWASPNGRSVQTTSPAVFASTVRVGLSSASRRETCARGTTAPVASVTRMRTRPVCAQSGAKAVSSAPIRTARRLRGAAGVSPQSNMQARPVASCSTCSHWPGEYCSTACTWVWQDSQNRTRLSPCRSAHLFEHGFKIANRGFTPSFYTQEKGARLRGVCAAVGRHKDLTYRQ